MESELTAAERSIVSEVREELALARERLADERDRRADERERELDRREALLGAHDPQQSPQAADAWSADTQLEKLLRAAAGRDEAAVARERRAARDDQNGADAG